MSTNNHVLDSLDYSKAIVDGDLNLDAFLALARVEGVRIQTKLRTDQSTFAPDAYRQMIDFRAADPKLTGIPTSTLVDMVFDYRFERGDYADAPTDRVGRIKFEQETKAELERIAGEWVEANPKDLLRSQGKAGIMAREVPGEVDAAGAQVVRYVQSNWDDMRSNQEKSRAKKAAEKLAKDAAKAPKAA